MFAWLWPRPPLDPWEKAWTECALHRLAQQLGGQRLTEARVALPEDFAGGPAPPTADDAREIVRQLCDWMRLDPSRVQLEVVQDLASAGCTTAPGSAKSACLMCLPATQLADRQLLVATLARELGHEVLRQAGGSGPETAGDLQQRGELVPTFLGLGVFAANWASAASGRGGWSWWAPGRHGHLPPRVLEYALALFAWLRDEPAPAWSRHLRLDAAAALRDGLRYLRRTNDSLFQTSTLHVNRDALSVNQLMAELDTGTPSARVAALWDLSRRGAAAESALHHVQNCLRHRHADVRAQATLTLASFPTAAAANVPLLVDRLHDESEAVRALAARALGRLGVVDADVVAELAGALEDDGAPVVVDAALALTRFGAAAAAAAPALLGAFRRALVDCHDETARRLAAALRAVAHDAEGQAYGYFNEHEDDLRELAGAIFSELSQEPTAG